METKYGGKAHNLYGPVVSDLKAVGKKSLEWDLNDWKWDGDLFAASPLNSVPSDCRSRQLFPVAPELPANGGLSNSSSSGSEDNNVRNENGKRELEKRRRVVVVEDEGLNNDEAGSLHLKLGGQVYPIMDGDAKSGKKTKIVGTTLNRAVCQVEDCRVDLSNAKDYHRRHKVCDMHSKATTALVGNVMQRFCQQCSRFHVLQEFDEGKRSCRRRLAGHNKRRRKTHPDNVVNGGSLNDERSSSYLLISLLRILSNMHSNSSDQTKDQDLLSHLFKNLASLVGTNNMRNISGLLQGSQGLLNTGISAGNVEKVPDVVAAVPQPAGPSSSTYKIDNCVGVSDCQTAMGQHGTIPASDLMQKGIFVNDAQGRSVQTLSGSQSTANASEPEATFRSSKMNDIDLNNVYDDSQDHVENLERSHAAVNSENGSRYCRSWLQTDSHKSSPPQTSANSDSTSSRSPSSSSGEAQSRTDRIVFKLFGKDPNDFPVVVRRQILDWLSHSPTDIESYIRPGCIILTIYLRLGKHMWEELCCDMGSSLRRLLDGQVVLDTPLPLKGHKHCRITSIKPIAVSVSESAKFIIKGCNLIRSTMRLLCALEGKYLVEEMFYDLMEGADIVSEHDEVQSFTFQCSIPNVSGRGFIEVEDHSLSSSFFPFIVAEQEVCSEICTLESAIETADIVDNFESKAEMTEVKNQALDFLHEMGWLLHRSQVKVRLGRLDPNPDLFPFERFKWLMEFSMEHDWCAVVKKLLSILFDGTIDTGEHTSIEVALLEMSLLHKAVKRNCRPMVELLLKYAPNKVLDKPGCEQKPQVEGGDVFIFKPDVVGPARLTPLHVAASRDDAENVLDALTDDPGMVGIEAWKSACDNTGLTPYNHACIRGHYSYIHLVQRKINKKSVETGHVVLDIPSSLSDSNSRQKPFDIHNKSMLSRVVSLQTEKTEPKAMQPHCRLCQQKLPYGNTKTSLVYRPAMLSMVAIAAVCVCVALLFKSSPEVLYIFRPFRWELLKYGSS
uniref:Squamosa promoter binding-like protein n=1 Tax=Litchi chinensis TaxID=151069 RepID=A0A2R4K346_LITCN|nr:squamosa promoter binding-like protein [Litchi chinensis]